MPHFANFGDQPVRRWGHVRPPSPGTPRTAGRQMPGPALLIRWQTATSYVLFAVPPASITAVVGIPPAYGSGTFTDSVPPMLSRVPVTPVFGTIVITAG